MGEGITSSYQQMRQDPNRFLVTPGISMNKVDLSKKVVIGRADP